MERTLTLETRALKAASRQWKELSPETTSEISMWTLFVHQTAHLIKDLTFTRLPEADNGAYQPASLRVGAAPYALLIRHNILTRPNGTVSTRCRRYICKTLVMQSMIATRLTVTGHVA